MIARKLKLHKIKIFAYCLTIIIVWLIFSRRDFFKSRLADEEFLGRTKCPACYGTNLCTAFDSGDIQLTGFTSWRVSQYFNVKNVYTGFWNSRNTSVIIKKLGYASELSEVDRSICQLAAEGPGCDVSLVVGRVLDTVRRDAASLDLAKLRTLFRDSPGLPAPDWLSCADQDLVNLVIRETLAHPSQPSLENILTMMMINQEPLLAATFSPDKQFPFPAFLGACGRLAVFSHAGESLDQVARVSPWNVRSAISFELLQMVNFLSNSSLRLALYPTDWSSEHFCVDKVTANVKLVDLENVVIVNLTSTQHLPFHKSDNYGCDQGECFSYSIPELCGHSASDHNYFAVCSNILSPAPHSLNLLSSPVQRVVSKYRSFPGLLDTCWRGGLKQRKDARLKSARNLEKILLEEIEIEENIF